jgi:hypothetical protein
VVEKGTGPVSPGPKCTCIKDRFMKKITIFFFFGGTEFELRALCLLGKSSIPSFTLSVQEEDILVIILILKKV